MAAPWSALHIDEWGRDPWETAEDSEPEEDRDARLKAWFLEALERIVGGASLELRTAIVAAREAKVGAQAPHKERASNAPEKSISDDSRDWADVLREWERLRSPVAATVKAGHKALAYLWEACGRITPQQVNRSHLAGFQTYLRDSGKSPVTARMQVSYVKTFLAIALDMGVIYVKQQGANARRFGLRCRGCFAAL